MLVLRTCNSKRQGHGGFLWPAEGPVEAPDWNPEPVCGYGLHGLAWGEGNGDLLNWDPSAVWLVVDVPDETVVNLGDKVKFPRGNVVHCGNRKSATDYLAAKAPEGKAIVGATVVVGVGDYRKACVGYRGTALAGDNGTAEAGDFGMAKAEAHGMAKAGSNGTAEVGYAGTAEAGNGGTALAGDFGTAKAGNYGTATAGGYGTAQAGNRGMALAGVKGTALAGYGGTIQIVWHDGRRKRLVTGYVGEDDILPNTPYHVKDGKLVR